jgi:hypothetical protein
MSLKRSSWDFPKMSETTREILYGVPKLTDEYEFKYLLSNYLSSVKNISYLLTQNPYSGKIKSIESEDVILSIIGFLDAKSVIMFMRTSSSNWNIASEKIIWSPLLTYPICLKFTFITKEKFANCIQKSSKKFDSKNILSSYDIYNHAINSALVIDKKKIKRQIKYQACALYHKRQQEDDEEFYRYEEERAEESYRYQQEQEDNRLAQIEDERQMEEQSRQENSDYIADNWKEIHRYRMGYYN